MTNTAIIVKGEVISRSRGGIYNVTLSRGTLRGFVN